MLSFYHGFLIWLPLNRIKYHVKVPSRFEGLPFQHGAHRAGHKAKVLTAFGRGANALASKKRHF